MDAQQIRTAMLVGHARGSFIAHRVAVEDPSRIARLVLIGSAATATWSWPLANWNTQSRALHDMEDTIHALPALWTFQPTRCRFL
jgi:pimeloyl-ACP methyl ester carboxylesterase